MYYSSTIMYCGNKLNVVDIYCGGGQEQPIIVVAPLGIYQALKIIGTQRIEIIRDNV